jgi:hypothetical protein
MGSRGNRKSEIVKSVGLTPPPDWFEEKVLLKKHTGKSKK